MFGPNGTTAAALEALRRLGRATSVICSQKATSGQVRRCGNGDGRQAVWEIAS